MNWIMSTSLVCLLVLSALYAEAAAYGVPGLYAGYQGEYAAAYDNYIPKPYAFEYGVSDPFTGDHKAQWETKDEAGVVRGSYSLLEPDGTTRIVDYVADDHGFRAVVKRIGVHGHPESIEGHGGVLAEAPLIAPIVVPEPGPVAVIPEPAPVPVLPEPVEAPIHINYDTPLPVEAVPLYSSYDGGLEHYQNVYNTQQVPFRVPEAQDAFVELPQHQFGGYIHQNFPAPNQVLVDQSRQSPLFVPNGGQPYGVPEPQYGAPGPYPAPEQPHQIAPVAPVPDQRRPELSQAALPVDAYQLELAYGEPHGLDAPRLILGGQGVPQIDNSIHSQPGYGYVDYGQDGRGDLGLNQGEYLPPGAVPIPYNRPSPVRSDLHGHQISHK